MESARHLNTVVSLIFLQSSIIYQLPNYVFNLQFRHLVSGYEETDIEQILRLNFAYTSNHTLLPGEGAGILAFGLDVIRFVNDLKSLHTATLVPVQLIYDIIDNILRQREALVDETVSCLPTK